MPVHPASQHAPTEGEGMMVRLNSESQQKMSRKEDEEQCSSSDSRTQSAALVTGSNHSSSSGNEKCSTLRTSSAHSKEPQGDIEYAVGTGLASTHHQHGERRRPQKERGEYLRMVSANTNEGKTSSQAGRRKQPLSPPAEIWDSGSSSGSGSDGGYDASASFSDSDRDHSSCLSPTLSCDSMTSDVPEAKQSLTSKIPASSNKRSSQTASSSSEIPDFSPGESGMDLDQLSEMSTRMTNTTKSRKRSRSKQGTATFKSGAMFPRGKKRPNFFDMLSSRPGFDLSCNRQSSVTGITGGRLLGRSIERVSNIHAQQHEQNQLKESYMSALSHSNEEEAAREANSLSISKKRSPRHISFNALQNSTQETSIGTPGIFSLGTDTMAQCLSFLEPSEVYSLLTVPISREWRRCFTVPKELWRVLCLSEPFNAKLDAGGDDELFDDSSDSSSQDDEIKHLFGKFRLLYTSFVRCTRYLARIKDDAVHGRPPSSIDDVGGNIHQHSFNSNSNLKFFLARARTLLRQNSSLQEQKNSGSESSASQQSNFSFNSTNNEESAVARQRPEADTGVTEDSGSSVGNSAMIFRNKKHGNSKNAESILGSDREGEAELPWSCAIYSLVNWMAFFSDVEGIQVMCLKVLPFLLDDENQRTTSQRAGLTDLVLRGMVLFPDSVELHTAAFHALVLLARPLGGKEGMLFHSVMVNASSIFNRGTSSGEHGMAVMLDSMKRFEDNEVLQAMSCWSMVNIALIPAQKIMLVKLGGIASAANAMMNHPYNAEVQFRALFALINLVIPSENLSENGEENQVTQEHTDDAEITCPTEREMQDENVSQIANLVVVAMKNFCSSEAILNRACLVLHNLSLNEDYHTTLLWTPNCYQMLEWCIANYKHDHVLQQSAGGTLQRLQATLSSDNDLRMRFLAALAQQQNSQELTRREVLSQDPQEDRTTSDEVIHA
uniref:F-box domain-containing protein n=1 Tax=Attheya septentrionalis TaxID=420275 RepID=A0A7S2U985_9STRA